MMKCTVSGTAHTGFANKWQWGVTPRDLRHVSIAAYESLQAGGLYSQRSPPSTE